MYSLSEANLIGNIGNVPELKTGNKTSLRLSIACTNKYTTQTGEKKETTNWFTVFAFDKQAETLAKYATKGTKIFLKCKLSNSKKEDGTTNITLIVSDFILLSSKSPITGESNNAPAYTAGGSFDGAYPDEIPF